MKCFITSLLCYAKALVLTFEVGDNNYISRAHWFNEQPTCKSKKLQSSRIAVASICIVSLWHCSYRTATILYIKVWTIFLVSHCDQLFPTIFSQHNQLIIENVINRMHAFILPFPSLVLLSSILVDFKVKVFLGNKLRPSSSSYFSRCQSCLKFKKVGDIAYYSQSQKSMEISIQ